MHEAQQQEAQRDIEKEFQSKIDLMDFLGIVWKWKYLTIAGMLICSIVAGVISYRMPKVYRVDMVIRPGMLSITKDGESLYIDSAENIKASIEVGTFDKQILKSIDQLRSKPLLKSLGFEANIPSGSNAVVVSYNTSSIDTGLQVVKQLAELLTQEYGGRVKYLQSEYETQVASKKAEAANAEAKRRAAEQHLINIKRRIDELRAEIDFVQKNTSALVQERDKFLSNNSGERDILSALLYTNTIQQNMSLGNSYKRQMQDLSTGQENHKIIVEEAHSVAEKVLEEIRDLEFKKNSIQNIQILQPPGSNHRPVKPRMWLNVLLATVMGLLGVMFVVSFVEYAKRRTGEPGRKVR